jgi:hypothetical protein
MLLFAALSHPSAVLSCVVVCPSVAVFSVVRQCVDSSFGEGSQDLLVRQSGVGIALRTGNLSHAWRKICRWSVRHARSAHRLLRHQKFGRIQLAVRSVTANEQEEAHSPSIGLRLLIFFPIALPRVCIAAVLCYCVFCGMDVFWACLRLILFFSGASDTSGALSGSVTSPLMRVDPHFSFSRSCAAGPGPPTHIRLPPFLDVWPYRWQYYVFVVGIIISPFIYVSGLPCARATLLRERKNRCSSFGFRCVGCLLFAQVFCCVSSYYLYKDLRQAMDESVGGMGMGNEEMGGGGGIYAAPAPAERQQQQGGGGGASWGHAEAHPAPAGFKPFSGTGNRLG